MTRHSSHFTIFGDGPLSKDLSGIREKRLQDTEGEYQNPAIKQLPDIPKEDFVNQGMDKIGLDIPEFDFQNLKKEQTGSAGKERLKYELRVNGNVDLLKIDVREKEVEEMTFTLNGKHDGTWLSWDVKVDGREPKEVEQEVEEKLQNLQKGLDILHPKLKNVNQEIKEKLETVYEERTEKSKENQDTIDSLDITTPDESD